MTTPLRIALVGAGSMGSLHARVVSQSERASLHAVIEPNADTGKGLAERFDSTWHADLDGLAGADAVIIAAATEAHHDLAMAVLAQGLPLLLEKPVAASLVQTEAI